MRQRRVTKKREYFPFAPIYIYRREIFRLFRPPATGNIRGKKNGNGFAGFSLQNRAVARPCGRSPPKRHTGQKPFYASEWSADGN
jgi:hypothetical protein